MEVWTLLGFLLFLALQPEIEAQDCGVAPLNPRIVGGENATEGAWPWQVSMHIVISSGAFHICGGTILNEHWVMTAAHCILTPTTTFYRLHFGWLTQTGPNPNEMNRTVSEIRVHPNYSSSNFENDIALMKLSTPINYTDYIRPVCLASNTSLFHNGTLCWGTGWGRLNNTAPNVATNVLQEVEIPVIGGNECTCIFDSVNLGSFIKPPIMVCAGETGRGICQGDSGGPIQCKQGSQWVQAGIASFGIPCAIGFPEVFARVSSYQSWIESQTSGTNVSFVEYMSAGVDSDASFNCTLSTTTTATTTVSSNSTMMTTNSTTTSNSTTTVSSNSTVTTSNTATGSGSRALPTELTFAGTVAIILLMPLFASN